MSSIGRQANVFIEEIPKHFPHVELGEFVIMPNHIHLLIGINVRTRHGVSAINNGVSDNEPQSNQFGKSIPGSISSIIGQFKSTLTRWCNNNGYAYFAWQSRFYDHVVRDQIDFDRIEQYIINNPTNWTTDKMFTL